MLRNERSMTVVMMLDAPQLPRIGSAANWFCRIGSAGLVLPNWFCRLSSAHRGSAEGFRLARTVQ
jgi:hypothetical protein